MSVTLLGNGRMRLTFDDICIRSIMTIDALHSFGELRCECTASVTRRLPCGGILQHELTGSMPSPNLTVDKHSTPDCRVTDLLMPDAPMLVRVIEAVDAVEFCFLPASDGNFRLFSDYPIGNRKHTVGVITMPDKREGTQLLYLIPAGRASFDKEGKLCAEPGSSVLILTAGKNPAKLVADAAKLIKRLEMPQPAAENMIYRQCETFWREKLSVLPRYYNSELFNSKVEEGALFLLSHFREDGAIITGQTRISEWIPIIECMAKLGFLREARGAADLIFSRWKSHGFTLALEEELSCTYPASAAPAHMAEAQLAYYSITKDDDFMREQLPMLIEAAMEIRQELFSGVFCFGGDERIFREGRLSPDAVDQASASATLRFIHITNTLIEFVRSHQLRSRKGYFDELLKSSTTAGRAWMREFYAEGMLWENNPRRLKHRRKPRFRWGICAVCGRETQLERDGCGEYTCFDCFGRAHEKKSYSQRTPAIGALELCCENHFSNRFSGIISDEMLRSVVIALAKTPLNLQDRAILLRLSARLIASGSEDEALQRVCAALYDQMLKENMNDTGDPATAARCILGLLAAKEVL